MTCHKCVHYDIVEGECTLHNMTNITGDHTCDDCDSPEEEKEDD